MALLMGELDIDAETSTPALLKAWDKERKATEVLDWLHDNFSPEGHEYFDLQNFENEDELVDEIESYVEDIEDILSNAFKSQLKATEIRALAKEVSTQHGDYWQPTSQRVTIHEVEVEQTLEELFDRIPSLLRHLDSLEADLPKRIGHNGGGGLYPIDRTKIAQTRALLKEIYAKQHNTETLKKSKLKKVAAACLEIGKSIAAYALQKGDNLVSGVIDTAGPEIGKWAPRGILLWTASEGFNSFGETLLKLIN